MKNQGFSIIIIYLILCTIPQKNHAQGWEWQNPIPQGNTLYSVKYVADDLFWACGPGGTLIKTVDGGATWEVILLPEKLSVYDIFFINEQKGWATSGADDGTYKIFLTTNGGSSWSVLADTLGKCQPIVFADENRGWTGDRGKIWATTNGGENWILQFDDTSNLFHSIFLLDNQRLWVTTEGSLGGPLLTTSNGGIDWIIDSTITWARDVHFIDTLVGWASGFSNVGKTTDGGLTWEIQYQIIQEDWIDVYMHDNNTGWAVSTLGKIISTIDGGESWVPQNNPTIKGWNSITFKNSSEGLIVGDLGTILKTTNGGSDWIDMLKTVTEESLSGIYFTDKNKGWIAGSNGLIITTSDGGNIWEHLSSGINNSLGDIYFINDMQGWAVGSNGTIIRSTDGGITWETQTSPINRDWSDIEFKFHPTGWIIGGEVFSDGRLLKTTDGGDTWNEGAIIFPPGARKIQFTSEDTGWIMVGSLLSGSEQIIYRSTDAGDNWEIVLTTVYPAEIMSMSFVNDLTGFVSTFDWKLYKTRDGGNNWDVIQLPTLFSQIYFLDKKNGWAGAAGGNIYYSNDGGFSWIKQTCPFKGVFNNLLMYDFDRGWAVSSWGNIIHTSNSPTDLNEYDLNTSKDFDYKLFQNYPNPFNSQTRIDYFIGKETKVIIKIFDVLGREINTLVDKEKISGNNSVTFDALNLSSGIYFYQLRTPHFSAAKKLLIIK